MSAEVAEGPNLFSLTATTSRTPGVPKHVSYDNVDGTLTPTANQDATRTHMRCNVIDTCWQRDWAFTDENVLFVRSAVRLTI